MDKRALLVGINCYEQLATLAGCVADATALQDLLHIDGDGTPNYHCRLLDSRQTQITRKILRASWNELFENFEGDALFYFSGHGSLTPVGGFLATYDWERNDPGLSMDELLTLANKSKAKSVLLVLDCCHSGSLGDPALLQTGFGNQSYLREGVTILAASRSSEPSLEIDGHGIFTNLLLGALSGGAADIRGYVSAASIYAYVEQALGPWEQRPVYKSHAYRLSPVRRCEPLVPDSLLRELPKIFKKSVSSFRMNPSYERTHRSAKFEHVTTFDKFKVLRNAGLLVTDGNKDLYSLALHSGLVKLSPLGQFYWTLAESRRL